MVILERDKLISAGKLHQEINRIYRDHYADSAYQFIHDFFRAMLRRVRNAPAVDAVSVVRCRACEHCMIRKKYLRCIRHGFTAGHEVKPDDYCSYGEKRLL